MKIKNLIIRIIFIYLVVLIGIFLLQYHIIYHPSSQKLTNPANFAPTFHPVALITADHLKLISWYSPAHAGKPTILFFHGNAGNIQHRVPIVQPYIQAGWGVFLLEYRDYAGNPGTVSETGFYRDAQAALNYLLRQPVNLSCIVLYGESLGTGVAVETALNNPVGAVVLQSAFTSIPDLAQAHYFYFPARWLVIDKYDSLSKINKIHVPILFIHSDQDNIVPLKYGKKLYRAANQPKQFILLRGAGHNEWNYQQLPTIVMPWVDSYLKKEKC